MPKPFILAFLLVAVSACQPAQDKLRATIDKELETCSGNYAIAYLNMSTGETFMLNEKKIYHAASTMKVPVMIEVFKQSSQGLFDMEDSIQIKNSFHSIVDQSEYQLSPIDDTDLDIYNMIGRKMTILDMTRRMITISSNLATNILIEMVDGKKVTQTMRGLQAKDIEVLRGVEDTKAYEQGLSNTTTAYDLMVIMKAIAEDEACNASDCEQMVDILLQQEYNEIIPALLPESVRVAHKTGSITGVHHDAGIVYLPDGSRYVLVILSEELEDFDRCTEMMAKISKIVYDYATAN